MSSERRPVGRLLLVVAVLAVAAIAGWASTLEGLHFRWGPPDAVPAAPPGRAPDEPPVRVLIVPEARRTPTPAADPPASARRAPILIDTAAALAAIAAAVEAESTFVAFWAEFRRAALAGDTARVVALTRFPFRTRGPMDDDPVRRHARPAFPRLFFGRLLAADPGLRPTPDTMRDLLARTERPRGDAVDPGRRDARVGDFVFARAGRGAPWRFTMAYTPDD